MELIIFYFSIFLVLFLPGYFLMLAILGNKRNLSWFERVVISFSLSLISVNFGMIIMGKFGILFSKASIIALVVIISTGSYAIFKKFTSKKNYQSLESENFSKKQLTIIFLTLLLTILVKTIYLQNTIFPTSTDLGHHMYWSKQISETGKLPTYQERDIISMNDSYTIGEPEKIADFIIGEHLIFSAIHILSEIDYISYFPTIILFLINIINILAVFILAAKLFQNFSFGDNATILALLFFGPLFALSSPQTKFVSGGVVGNTIGNLLIPVIIYFIYLAFSQKDRWFLFSAIFLAFGMAYVHHLSSFVYIFILTFIALYFIIVNIAEIKNYLVEWKRFILKKPNILILIFAVIFIIIYTPSYVNTSAVGSAVGEPIKETRTGLSFNQLKFSIGESRVTFGLIGLVILFFVRQKSYESAIIIGWNVAILLMTLKPHWLYLDLPSNRISTYANIPLTLSSSFSLAWIISKIFPENTNRHLIGKKISLITMIIILLFFFSNGSYDNSQSIVKNANYQDAIQTFHVSQYLSQKITSDDIILKDHNYITADSWMKLYFMRDYKFPLSRGFFKRYEDPINSREMCTLWMISNPRSENATKCYLGTKTNYIIINTQSDSAQFEKMDNFWKIYENEKLSVFYRN